MFSLVLKDGTSIELKDYMDLSTILVKSADKGSLVETWNKFTQSNVSEVQIMKDDVVFASFENVLLDSVSIREQEDGTLLTIFALRQKTEVELLKEQTAAQADTIDMLTGCVLEMSEVVYA